MSVLLSNGQKNLVGTFHHILDTFLSNIDSTRGFFIKPNIVFPVSPKSGEITSPTLVKNLIYALRERYANLDVVIGEGVAAGCIPTNNFTMSGYADMARELKVPLLDLHEVNRRTIKWKFGKIDLPDIAFDRIYINFPILKPSSACIISGALKNQKGLLIPFMKKHFHRLGLHEQIAELNAVVKPALTLMECRNFFGKYDFISGDNCGEIDATVCELLKIEEPEHIVCSRSANVFSSGFSVTSDATFKRNRSKKPSIKDFKRIGRLRLWSNSQACTMCRYLFTDIQQNILDPHYSSVGLKLLAKSVQGAEIIMGLNPDWEKEYDTVFCIGNCTRNIAKKGGYTFIPGCPPTMDDLNENI